jgi:hypothetical protein
MNEAGSRPVPPPEVSIYRRMTISMLRRYFNMSVELGRLPSLMGREVFRSRVSCRPLSFEGFVIYVLDIERCLQRLRKRDQELITRVVLQEYTQEEAARLLGCPVIAVERRLPEVLDSLTATFLELGLLKIPTKYRPACAHEGDTSVQTTRDQSVVENICASAQIESASVGSVALRNKVTQEVAREVPLEIFMSSPLNVTNQGNCHVQ